MTKKEEEGRRGVCGKRNMRIKKGGGGGGGGGGGLVNALHASLHSKQLPHCLLFLLVLRQSFRSESFSAGHTLHHNRLDKAKPPSS